MSAYQYKVNGQTFTVAGKAGAWFGYFGTPKIGSHAVTVKLPTRRAALAACLAAAEDRD